MIIRKSFLGILGISLLFISTIARTEQTQCIDNVGGSCSEFTDGKEIENRLCCTTNGFVFCHIGVYQYADCPRGGECHTNFTDPDLPHLCTGEFYFGNYNYMK
jgi:hypothetical protein